MGMINRFASLYCESLMLCFDSFQGVGGGNDFQWCFSQVKGAIDEDVAEGEFTQINTHLLILAHFTCRNITPIAIMILECND